MIHIGSRVRIANGSVLGSALRARDARLRPQPDQMLCAGRSSRVVGVRRGPRGEDLYLLDGLPGLWPEAWIEPR